LPFGIAWFRMPTTGFAKSLHCSGKEMSSSRKCVLLFLVGLVAGPVFVFLHELRHYATASALGGKPTMHYRMTICATPSRMGPSGKLLVVVAGPLGDGIFAGAGLLWLYVLRRHRREAAPTRAEWFATILAMSAARWLRGWSGPPAHPQPGDEVFLSQALGMPGWLLPYLLALVCVIPLVAVVRLHPPGARLIPFLLLVLGGLTGRQLWMRVVGPFLLP
jgi:hypothetical protein